MDGRQTDGWRLNEDQVRAWLTSLAAGGWQVAAPVEVDRGLLLYRAADPAGDIRLDARRARWSAKEFLLPATETLLSYRYDGEAVLMDAPAEPPAQILLGLRPCDAAGTARLDEQLAADQLYVRRRERTVIISVACASAEPSCFCTAVGGSPVGTEGSDLQLVPRDGSWLLRPLTGRGRALADGADANWARATQADFQAVENLRRQVEESIGAETLEPGLAAPLADRFGAAAWQALGERCLGCGLCAFVCPSCGCFDVTDDGDAVCGTRCRTWDSCGLARFTRHAAGYNPRADQPARFRQRILHKLAWFPLEHGSFMCVGCGRCTELCPAGLDIRQSLRLAMEQPPGQPAAESPRAVVSP